MADFPIFPEYFRIFTEEVLSKNVALALDAVERDGADANILGAAASATAEEVTGQIADLAEGLFLDSAKAEKLDRFVFDRYGLIRKAAANALGSVEFSTVVPNPTAFSIPVNTELATVDGVQFLTTTAATFPALSNGPVTVAVRSSLAGAGQNAKAGSITNIVGSIPGAAADLAVTNTTATAGAAEQESDDSLRDRARRFFTTARRGTIAAIEQGALAVSGVIRASAIEVVDVSARPARLVELIIADEFTDALVVQGADPPAYEVQSQQLAQTVFNALADVRAAGIFVQVRVAQVQLQPITLQLRFQAGADVDLVTLVARGTILATVNDLEPGAPLIISDLVDRLRGVAGLEIQGDEVASPPGDVIADPLQVIRTSLSLVQASVQSVQDVQLNQAFIVDIVTSPPVIT